MERWPIDIFRGTERFELLRCLGEGGMGVVYEALDRERNLRVALKTLRSLSPQDVLSFKSEFRAVQDLDHPNLVRLDNLHEHQGHWFFTMELVEGSDFLSWVRKPEDYDGEGSGYDEARLRSSFRQLAEALEAIHAAGKVHRDVKPSNARVTPEGRVVLLDFGLVTDLSAEESVTDARLVGTTLYMAPEQAASQRVGPEADWYAFGIMLYEALTGQVPFSGPPLAILLNKQRIEPPPPSALVPSVPADLDALCARLLRFDPRRRATGRDVLACFAPRFGSAAPANDNGLTRTQSALGSSLQRPPFVGRARELAMLDEAFAATRAGRVQSVVLRGPSGVGKTALVREFIEALRGRHPETLVLAGRCYDRESVPYKAFDGAIDALCRHLKRLDEHEVMRIVGPEPGLVARLFPAFSRLQTVRRAAALKHEIPNPQELRQRAFAALRGMLSRLALSGPLVLSIDDFQWADTDSVALLTELLRKPDAPPLLLLVTMRPGSARNPPEDATTVDLGGLSKEESEVLVGLLAQRFNTSVDADALAREAEGHPMFLQELVQHVAHVGTPAQRAARLEDALLSRIGRLEPSARRLLDVLAVAGAPIHLRVAGQAAGLTPQDAARSAAVLRVAMLTRSSGAQAEDRVEPYHDRIREAVFGRLDEATRRELHAQLADAIEADDPRLADPHVLLGHLEAAGQLERAAAQAERAAALAARALAFDRAAMLYRTALRLGGYTGERLRAVYAKLGDALANAGRCAEAAEAFFAAAEGAEAASRLAYRRLAAEQLLLSGHVDQGLSELSAVLSDMKLRIPRTPRGALFSLLHKRAVLRLRGLKFTPRDASEVSRQDLERLELHRAIGQGLCFADTIRGFDFHLRGLLLALRVGEPNHVARALVMEAVFEGTDGVAHVPRAEKLLADGRAIAERTQDPYLLAYVLSSSGVVQFFAGRFREAAALIEQGEQMFRDRTSGTTWELNHSRIFLLHSYLQLGRLADLCARVTSYLDDAARRGDLFAATTMTRSFNFAWLYADDVEGARKELAKCTWSPPETGFIHLQHWFEIKAHVEIALYEGKPVGYADEIKAVGRSLLMRPQAVRIDFVWMCGRVALSRENADLKGAARAARKLLSEGLPNATVWGLLLRAAIATHKGRHEQVTALLEEACKIADEHSLLLLAAIARMRLGQYVASPRSSALMRDAEAWLKSQGIVRPERILDLYAPGFVPCPVPGVVALLPAGE